MIASLLAMAAVLTPATAEANYRNCVRHWEPEGELAGAPQLVVLGRAAQACANERKQFVDSVDLGRSEENEALRAVRRNQAEWRVGEFEAQLLRVWVRSANPLSTHDQELAPLTP